MSTITPGQIITAVARYEHEARAAMVSVDECLRDLTAMQSRANPDALLANLDALRDATAWASRAIRNRERWREVARRRGLNQG